MRTNAYGISLEPSLSLAYSQVELGGFTGSGAGGADLSVASVTGDFFEAQGGACVSKTFVLAQGRLTVEGRLAGLDELRNPAPSVRESFAAAPGRTTRPATPSMSWRGATIRA